MTTINSSSLSRYNGDPGERVLIGSCTPLEAALRYVSPDGLKIDKDKPAVSLKSNPIEPFDYWLCRKKGLSAEAGSLVRDYHHGPPKDPSRVNLSFLEDVARQAKNETSEYTIYNPTMIKMEKFLKALFRKTCSRTDRTGTLNKFHSVFQTLYFPVTDGKTGAHFHPSNSRKFIPGQYVHFIQHGELLSGIVKDVFEQGWPKQYSVVRQEDGPAYLVSHGDLVTHQNFQRSMPTQDGSYWNGVDSQWMEDLKLVFKGLGANVSAIELWACFHHCRCFSMKYDRLSWVKRTAESESNRKQDMMMVPKSELVIQSYLKSRSHFQAHWEPFRPKDWVQNMGRYKDGDCAIIPQMRDQSQELFKGYALKVEIDGAFVASFLPPDCATPPAKKSKAAA